jgi:hypothetical protein
VPDARVALVAALVVAVAVAVVAASEARWVEVHEVVALVAHADSNKKLLQFFGAIFFYLRNFV